jgi:pimeloyl-ACP methyl ester carboxylesterase
LASGAQILAHSPYSLRHIRKRSPTSMSDDTHPNQSPTVVLVHGAFADGSSWNDVIERLQSRGVTAVAAANPLRGISADSKYIAGVLEEIPGPVVAVGHSYGGAVISNAAANVENVVGLVFVAAFAPEQGERLGEVAQTSKDAVLGGALVAHQHQEQDGAEPSVTFSIDRAKFHEAFAADLPQARAAVMAATQRPVSELAFSEPSEAPAWKSLPSWAVVATADKAAGTDITRSMSTRAGSTITEVDGSHVIMVSQPEAVTNVILDAVAASSASERAWGDVLVENYVPE